MIIYNSNIYINSYYISWLLATLTLTLPKISGSVIVTASSNSHITPMLQLEHVVFKVISIVITTLLFLSF